MHANAETAKCAQSTLDAINAYFAQRDSSATEACERAEVEMIGQLRLTGILHSNESAYVEYGCAEHGVVHVNAWCEETQTSRWIEVSPKTGDVSYY